ncbi:MAG TPA: TraR/DksA C4-type zinc finger protein [Candidatus Polarisedimenticolaceae bacterium]|nr:TraR/DksA C4-type zinc finger protein [Candidatus Polarisedimenticolaceae bacterium]
MARTVNSKKKAAAKKGQAAQKAKKQPAAARPKPKPAARVTKPKKTGGTRAATTKKAQAGKTASRKAASAKKPKTAGAAVTTKAPTKKAAGAKPTKGKKAGRAAKTAVRRRQLKRFRDVLLARHKSLVEAYHSTKGNTRDSVPDGTEDYIDYAVSSYDRDFSLSLTEMERRQMRLVEEALRRIDRGEFGSCMQCAQEIPEKRLEVEPWARHCIRCQELEEQGLLQDRPFELEDEDEDSSETSSRSRIIDDDSEEEAPDQEVEDDSEDEAPSDAVDTDPAGDEETEDELTV